MQLGIPLLAAMLLTRLVYQVVRDKGVLRLSGDFSAQADSLLSELSKFNDSNSRALKAKGVGFSLGDFETGYSSLACFKRLPLDQLKIDRSFAQDVLVDANDAVIAMMITALAQSLDIGFIADGIESAEQRDFLAASRCHCYQGPFFSVDRCRSLPSKIRRAAREVKSLWVRNPESHITEKSFCRFNWPKHAIARIVALWLPASQAYIACTPPMQATAIGQIRAAENCTTKKETGEVASASNRVVGEPIGEGR